MLTHLTVGEKIYYREQISLSRGRYSYSFIGEMIEEQIRNGEVVQTDIEIRYDEEELMIHSIGISTTPNKAGRNFEKKLRTYLATNQIQYKTKGLKSDGNAIVKRKGHWQRDRFYKPETARAYIIQSGAIPMSLIERHRSAIAGLSIELMKYRMAPAHDFFSTMGRGYSPYVYNMFDSMQYDVTLDLFKEESLKSYYFDEGYKVPLYNAVFGYYSNTDAKNVAALGLFRE